MKLQTTGLALALGMLAASTAGAQMPLTIRTSGTFFDQTGSPLDGPYRAKVVIWDGEGRRARALWTQDMSIYADRGKVELELSLPLQTFVEDEERWLGIILAGGLAAEPRIRFLSAPYAYRAAWADNALSHEEIVGLLREDPRFATVELPCADGRSCSATRRPVAGAAGRWPVRRVPRAPPVRPAPRVRRAPRVRPVSTAPPS